MSNKFFLLALLVLVFSNINAVEAIPLTKEKQSGNVALLLGIQNYSEVSGISNLNYAKNDATDLEKLFKSLHYKTILLTDADVRNEAIEDKIDELKKFLDKTNGVFLVTFSGHGYSFKKENYLATANTYIRDGKIPQQGLKIAKLRAMVRATGAKKRVFFLDACRNDLSSNTNKGLSRIDGIQKNIDYSKNAGEKILYGAKNGSFSYEHRELRKGVLTHFIIKAFQSKNSAITFNYVANFVHNKVSNWVLKKIKKAQIPYTAGESTGSFILSKKRENLPCKPPKKYKDKHKIKSYEGNCRNGVPYGQGKIIFHNGDIYTGNLINGLPNGKGIMTFSNKDTYTGNFKNGLYDGWFKVKKYGAKKGIATCFKNGISISCL